MSRLLLQPAVWPHLALNPEPKGTAMDADSVERLYSEWFGADSGIPVEPVPQAQARIQPMKPVQRYRPSCLPAHVPEAVAMSKMPGFIFYTSDWLGDSGVRRCTHEQRGTLIDVMCFFHDSEEYGVLHWPLKEIAHVVGCKVSNLKTLVEYGIIKGADPGDMCAALVYVPVSGRQKGSPVTLIPEQPGPLWYSSRMVRDHYKRQHKGESTRFKPKEDPAPDSPCPRQGERQGDGMGERQGDGYPNQSQSLSFNPLLRSDSAPAREGKSHGANLDPVLLALPCQKGKHYHLTQSKLNEWKEAFPELDPLSEARQMKFWLEHNAPRQKTYAGMGKFISSWLARSRESVAQKAGAPSIKGQAGEDYVKQNAEFFGGVDEQSA